jgi:uncharacterized membrane protein YeiH
METNQTMQRKREGGFGPLKIGILILGLVTAIIHGVVLNVMMGGIDPLFTLNGLGYLALLVAYFLPWSIFQNNRNLIRWVYIGYTALTIVAWAVLVIPTGNWTGDTLGLITKAVEILLIVFLFLDGRR